ncbi:hypothetical protein EC973_008027 [Apophysomyces ossiformis]|uniref:BTB domain-containing protein n=1 Tax=Apophysomyces ossiformis TaxID=679940 RepID=A0A8H7BT30_9FUNG|nr:hypothetical protein EC973_008027 [Apophysomyces ossiformis]
MNGCSSPNTLTEYSYDYAHTPQPSPPSHPPQQPSSIPMPLAVPVLGHVAHHQQHVFFAPPHPAPPLYNIDAYCDYLYHVGYLQGQFSDVNLTVPRLQKTYALHSLIISRSPEIYRRLTQNPHSIELDLDISPEALHTILGHLYKPLSHHDLCYFASEKPRVCAELLDAAEQLGLDQLLDRTLHIVAQSLSQSSVYYWITAMHSFNDKHRRWVESLDHHLVQYLTIGLATQLEAFSTTVKMSGGAYIGGIHAYGYMPSKTPPTRGMMDLAHVYAVLPLDYLKRCLEHVDLPVQDAIQRYHFAKQVLTIRENLGKHGLSVVLRVDGEANLLIVKKAKKIGKWDPSQYDVRSK